MDWKQERKGLDRAQAAPAVPPTDAAVAIGLEPLRAAKRRWPAILGAGLTVLMVIGLGRELFGGGLDDLTGAVPTSPLFYLFFVALYFSLPVADYLIFRRLWGVPPAGLAATIKKRIANEVLFSYSGEAYFYAWARANATVVAAPFGAVKDVSILSAVAGNAMTLLLMALSVPLGHELLPQAMRDTAAGSAVVLVAMSLPFLIFSRRVFSLPRPELWWIFNAHVVRLVAGTVFIALAWHFALPEVPVAMWLFLAAGRLLVSRLPLVPNKDLLFANFAIVIIGQDQALSELMAFTAALTLVVHVVLIAAFGLHHLATRGRAL
ncbi:hypothetical protein [Sphingomonas lenta]|uniref:Uncharacterized protein n=1 Tax=Sphingomonas lenta TaxID=1141887 RepID=A0A2A2SD29_9SPHN|nr:hypothetical protein [Sphingomonas lenta]PAX06911.1 hypothetical protein CKY28_12615 [Sphingomonas lenta]